MTDRDSRTSSGCTSCNGTFESAAPAVSVEVAAGGVEQAHNDLAAMIARDVRVQVLPDALDAVRVWAVRGQEMEHDAAPRAARTLRVRRALWMA